MDYLLLFDEINEELRSFIEIDQLKFQLSLLLFEQSVSGGTYGQASVLCVKALLDLLQ